jgi:aryl-alcohol dehydrogenase-like predicted oxidoreductase
MGSPSSTKTPVSTAAPTVRGPWLYPGAHAARGDGAPPLLAVGTMNFGRRTPAPEAERIVRRALDRGIALFDTANVYNDGAAERILGRALGKDRARAFVATKAGLARIGKRSEGLGAKALAGALDASLSRLGTDYVDVFYLHAPDPETPFEETLDAVFAILRAGKARAWGMSNFASWQILEAMQLAATRELPPPLVAQQLYNVLVRELEIEYFAFAARHPIHTTVYNPLAGGLLARAPEPAAKAAAGSRLETNPMYRRRYGSTTMAERAAALDDVARGAGMTLLELAYRWVAYAKGVDSVLLGPATTAHLDDAVRACETKLDEAVRKQVDELCLAFAGTDTHYAR